MWSMERWHDLPSSELGRDSGSLFLSHLGIPTVLFSGLMGWLTFSLVCLFWQKEAWGFDKAWKLMMLRLNTWLWNSVATFRESPVHVDMNRTSAQPGLHIWLDSLHRQVQSLTFLRNNWECFSLRTMVVFLGLVVVWISVKKVPFRAIASLGIWTKKLAVHQARLIQESSCSALLCWCWGLRSWERGNRACSCLHHCLKLSNHQPFSHVAMHVSNVKKKSSWCCFC